MHIDTSLELVTALYDIRDLSFRFYSNRDGSDVTNKNAITQFPKTSSSHPSLSQDLVTICRMEQRTRTTLATKTDPTATDDETDACKNDEREHRNAKRTRPQQNGQNERENASFETIFSDVSNEFDASYVQKKASLSEEIDNDDNTSGENSSLRSLLLQDSVGNDRKSFGSFLSLPAIVQHDSWEDATLSDSSTQSFPRYQRRRTR